jgi:hypothetical protein
MTAEEKKLYEEGVKEISTPEDALEFLDALLVRLAALTANLERQDAGECADCHLDTPRRYGVGRFSLCHHCARCRVLARGLV